MVDEKDREIGVENKLAAHQDGGKLHRAFSIFILRDGENGLETLLQQRQDCKYHCGGLWVNSCCGHPRPGEDLVAAAKRRLYEEMGFTAELKVIGHICYKASLNNELTEYEYDNILIGFKDVAKPHFTLSEVKNSRWIGWADLRKDLVENSECYAPWLREIGGNQDCMESFEQMMNDGNN